RKRVGSAPQPPWPTVDRPTAWPSRHLPDRPCPSASPGTRSPAPPADRPAPRAAPGTAGRTPAGWRAAQTPAGPRILDQIDRDRNAGQMGRLGKTELQQEIDLLVDDPMRYRGHVGFPGDAADALHLAALDREPQPRRGIAGHDLELGAEHRIE